MLFSTPKGRREEPVCSGSLAFLLGECFSGTFRQGLTASLSCQCKELLLQFRHHCLLFLRQRFRLQGSDQP